MYAMVVVGAKLELVESVPDVLLRDLLQPRGVPIRHEFLCQRLCFALIRSVRLITLISRANT